MARSGPSTPPETKPRRPARLWPLLALPLAGLCLGIAGGHRNAINAGHASHVDYLVRAATGLAAGSFLMSLVALMVLFWRLAMRQFTLRTLLIAIAAAALMLGLVRGCFA